MTTHAPSKPFHRKPPRRRPVDNASKAVAAHRHKLLDAELDDRVGREALKQAKAS
jgi:hypothetical protein